MNPNKLRDAARLLGARNLGKTKTLSDTERERRRTWARGLSAKKAAKRAAAVPMVRVLVIDRAGQAHPYEAASIMTAIELARANGIDAVGGRMEATQQTKGNEQ